MSEILTKTCKRCGVEKELLLFTLDKRKPFPSCYTSCKDCTKESKKNALEKRKQAFSLLSQEEKFPCGNRVCKKCKTEKSHEMFSMTYIGYSPWCKDCKGECDRKRRWAGRIDTRHLPKPELKNKICSKCKTERDIDLFKANKAGKPTIVSICKLCKSEAGKIYSVKNKEELRLKAKLWRQKNIERVRARERESRKSNQPKRAARVRNRRQTDPEFKLLCNLRTQAWRALKGIGKESKTLELLGCTSEEFKKYIESKFEPEMTWDNYTKDGWHLDHLAPLASYNLFNPDHQKECFHFTNLCPRWATNEIAKKHGSNKIGNVEKSDKIIGVDFHEPLL